MVDVYGTCAVCEGPLPPGAGRGKSRQRVICNDPACKRATLDYARRITNARRQRAAVAEVERRCPQCEQTKPLTAEHWYHDAARGQWDRWCRPCRRRKARENHRRNREQIAVRQAKRYATHKTQMTPEELELERARKRDVSRRYREQHPERARATRRQWEERMRADPQAYAAYLENRRIAHRLRREKRDQLSPDTLVVVTTATMGHDDDFRRLPARPLGEAVQRVVDGEQRSGNDHALEVVCERAGVTPRTLFAWRTGERELVQFDVADAVLVGLDLLWWEVWSPDGFPDVAAVWDPEAAAA